MPMPRKHKCCQFTPVHSVFKPRSIPTHRLDQVVLPVEFMETVLLCDLLGLDQEAAGQCMGVSRGTVQRYVNEARRRIADALINGKALMLESANPYHQGCQGRCQRRQGEER
jgi:predicted DNA-binding protein (UPF0251 family)